MTPTEIELNELRERFDQTRYRILQALGADDMGLSWDWIETTIIEGTQKEFHVKMANKWRNELNKSRQSKLDAIRMLIGEKAYRFLDANSFLEKLW